MLYIHLLKTSLKLYFYRKTCKDIFLIFRDCLKLLTRCQLFRNFYNCTMKVIVLKLEKISYILRISVMTSSLNPLLMVALIIWLVV
jgi:hypothetical protein